MIEWDRKLAGEGLSFDDLLLIPAESSVLPKETDVRTRLTSKITLNVPLLAAAMDTVSETALAIALAREGGLTIIHKNQSIERQADMVRKVKRSEAGMIVDPITLPLTATYGHAEEPLTTSQNLVTVAGGTPLDQSTEQFKIHKIEKLLVVDDDYKLRGMITIKDITKIIEFPNSCKDDLGRLRVGAAVGI